MKHCDVLTGPGCSGDWPPLSLNKQAKTHICSCPTGLLSLSLTYPLTARVTGAPQVTSQPVFLHFSVHHCPLGLDELRVCPFSNILFPPLLLSVLSFFALSLCLAKWFGPDLINGRHVYHCSLHFTMLRLSSCGLLAWWISAQTSSLVTWFL